ncbi:MAG: HNH endonuclease signature motif containing protein [Geminicoccaceae bacterium]
MPEPNSGCWLWIGNCNQHGYGAIKVNGKNHKAHRISYQIFKGEIARGLHIDHLCSVRCCVNPDHLESVTVSENRRRTIERGLARFANADKTHCKRGHPLSGHNLRVYPDGSRQCRICLEATRQRYLARKRARLQTDRSHGHQKRASD